MNKEDRKLFKEYKKILRKHGCLRAQRRYLANREIGLSEWVYDCLYSGLYRIAVARAESSCQEERRFLDASREWIEFYRDFKKG